jgi:SSS family solute:Na+ symporter
VNLLALFISVLALYLAVGTLLAILSRRSLRGGLRDYYTSGGRLGSFLSAMTYAATTYSSFMIVGLVGYAYATGAGAYGFELTYYIATLGILALIARRAWRLSRERGWVSPGEMVADLTGSRWVAPLLSLIYLGSLIFYAGAQLKAIGEVVAAAGGQEWYTWGVVIGLITMLIWSSIAGIWSVAVTDAFQGLWMIFAGLGLIGWVYIVLASNDVGLSEAGRILLESGHLTPSGYAGYWSLTRFLSFTLPWIFFAVTNPQALQRLYMPRDEKSLSNMIKWFAVFGLTYTIIVTLTGLLAYAGKAAGVIPINVEASVKYAYRVTPSLLTLANPILSAVVFTSIIAAAVSTADSILLTLASSVSVDLLPRSARERVRFIAGISAIVLVGLGMALIALLRVSFIVKLSVLSSLLLLGTAPPILALLAGVKIKGWAAGLASLMGPLLVLAELVRMLGKTSNPVVAIIMTFGATPLKIPIAGWILIASTILTIAGISRSSQD